MISLCEKCIDLRIAYLNRLYMLSERKEREVLRTYTDVSVQEVFTWRTLDPTTIKKFESNFVCMGGLDAVVTGLQLPLV